jgi:starch synthase
MSHTPRILMISSEVESLARTGGLGDVVEALSLAVARSGAHVIVVTPLYGVSRVPKDRTRWPRDVSVRHGWGPADVRPAGVVELETTRFPSGGTRRICLVDDPGLYGRAGIYGDAWGTFGDNALRFAVLSRGALEIAERAWDGGPDVIHAHDWHASLAVIYARTVMGDRWARTPSIFTIHNLSFQGVLGEHMVDQLHVPRSLVTPEILWHEGQVNLMKGATALADRITTVSPTYAREILTPDGGFGLDGHLRAHAAKLVGIVNGIDTERFDPAKDPVLGFRFDAETAERGRAACKKALRAELGLVEGDGPVFATVSRLTWQKGIDLVLPILEDLVSRGAQVVVVGQGETWLEDQLVSAQARFPGDVAVRIAFDPALSRRVYAAADFFLVPSRFEPCGLTQLYAMHYGAIPVVTDVGGLHDTVQPVSADGTAGTGFVAARPDVASMRAACVGACELFADREAKARIRTRGMGVDVSWGLPAREYRRMYESLRGSSAG